MKKLIELNDQFYHIINQLTKSVFIIKPQNGNQNYRLNVLGPDHYQLTKYNRGL